MRQNLPVTNVEVPFPRGRILVSKTDLKSHLTYANDAFIELSGYSGAELLGQPHNLVRHPDMPPVVFADLWKTLQAGHPWRGLVKNRRKDGGFYWVEALVVPIHRNGQVTGYMSVRTEPNLAEVRAAELLYQQLRGGSRAFSSARHGLAQTRLSVVAGVALGATAAMLTAQAVLGGSGLQMALGGAGVVLCGGFYAWLCHRVCRPLDDMVANFQRMAEGHLGNPIDIYGKSEVGRATAALASMQVQLRVVVDEIRLAEELVSGRCQELEARIAELGSRSSSQQDRIMQVTAAMEEVSVSINEVASNARHASEATQGTRELLDSGNRRMGESLQASARAVEAVDEAGSTVERMGDAIREIGKITEVIQDVASQTNLLALNAAIEAARAGEQGRGFAVVADEVRKLAERTTSSTAKIARMIDLIQQTSATAVAAMAGTAREVGQGRATLSQTEQNFADIVFAGEQVLTMTGQIAEATREQSIAGEEVARNMELLSHIIEENTQSVAAALQANRDLGCTAMELHQIVDFFSG